MDEWIIVGQPGNYTKLNINSIKDSEGNTVTPNADQIASAMTEQEVDDTIAILNARAADAKAADVTTSADYQKGIAMAQNLFSFFPDEVTKEFAKAWVKHGDQELAQAATRKTAAWKKHFDYLERDDGTLIMSELDALSTKASFRETLGEVGIGDTSMFEESFNEMIKGEVKAAEFQQRVDLVYANVKDQIPEVERLFREQYNINVDQPTIFAALINPDIEDKLLRGELLTLQLQAQASSKGFSTTFARFNELRKAGLTMEQAGQIYGTGQQFIERAGAIGRDIDITTLEQAAIGDYSSQQRIARTEAELLARGGLTLGAAKKGDQVTGLLEK